jgi:hypothetical protein
MTRQAQATGFPFAKSTADEIEALVLHTCRCGYGYDRLHR